jgi:carboxypeptidase family protein
VGRRCEKGAASQETGSANYYELFSEGERIMAALTFLFFLLVPQSEIVKGTVFDPAGGVVAGAKVEVTGRGLARSESTNASGVFSIEDIPAGSYSLRITASG